MALTRSFKETIQERVERDAEFREELLREGIQCLLAGDLETGKAVLRDYINGSVGFTRVHWATSSSSVMVTFFPPANEASATRTSCPRFMPPPA